MATDLKKIDSSSKTIAAPAKKITSKTSSKKKQLSQLKEKKITLISRQGSRLKASNKKIKNASGKILAQLSNKTPTKISANQRVINKSKLILAKRPMGKIAASATPFDIDHLANKYHLSEYNNAPPAMVEMVMDFKTKRIIHAVEHERAFLPASLTKVMTAFLVFEKIQRENISLNTEIVVPEHATKVPRCKIYLKAGQKIKLIDALKATIISSANDAAETLGHYLAGSRSNLSHMMTAEAKKLGMHNTRFINASGLHHDLQKTTAKDLAILTLKIKQKFPAMYRLFAETSYEYAGKTYNGHNNITKYYDGAEGLKTGYTAKSGYNLISVATKQGVTLLAIVAGSKSGKIRDKRMMALLDESFRKMGVDM